jgi:type IV pilus assembly protein PilM
MAFKKKKNNLIGLDVGSRTLKVAELAQTKQGYELKKFGMSDVEPGLIEEGTIKNPEAVADSIRRLFKMYKIKEQNVAISIGGYSIIVKTITVPTMKEDKLHEQIHVEAESYIPFDIKDVNLDFQIFGEHPEEPSQMDVLLVAAKKEIVNDYANLIRLAGLTPCVMDVDAFALQNVYEANYDTESENVALIDIGANKATLNILKGGFSVLIRDVSFGCRQITQRITSEMDCSPDEAEKMYQDIQSDDIASKEVIEIISSMVGEWCAEIGHALEFFYSTYPGESIQRIVLSGGGANIKTFREKLAEETSCEVEIINPFESVRAGKEFDPSYLERVAPQAAICMGLAMRKADDK